MKNFLTALLLLTSTISFAQSNLLRSYHTADSLIKAENFRSAYNILKRIEPNCGEDTICDYVLWAYTNATSQLEKQFRDHEQFDSSLKYGLEALQLIEKGKPRFNATFASREYFMIKNIVVSYFGLGQLDKANTYKAMLYQAYRDKLLPEGMDEYFNFTFFKWEGKNIWGYEWFEDLPEDRFSKSFSKVVYYVYSTNPDGTDKDQLYRLHVLMFHNIDPSNGIDYVLTKRLETATDEVSGTLYSYTYAKDIDYKKLQADIREVLKGNYEVGSGSRVKKH